MTISAPRWDMTNVYPSLKSKEFKSHLKYQIQLDEMEDYLLKPARPIQRSEPRNSARCSANPWTASTLFKL